jgi:L-threonylcarbamoyladenylate synthase
LIFSIFSIAQNKISAPAIEKTKIIETIESITKPMLTLANDTLRMTYDYDFHPVLNTLGSAGIILFPTDINWGIGCDATDLVAIEKVVNLKNKIRQNPPILLVSSIEMLRNYVTHLHPRMETLLMHHIRPLTIVYEQAQNLPTNAYADGGNVAIRLVQDNFCKKIIEEFGRPVLCTSARIGNAPIPNHFGEISSEVLTQVNFIVKYRQGDKDMGEKSVVARLSNAQNAELEFLN